jgi:ankyrin repeat protein
MKHGRVEIVQVFLQHHDGIDADARDANLNNVTPLHWASIYGRVEVARALLGHGVDANAQDVESSTPLHLASCFAMNDVNYPDIVRLLLQYGSDIHARDDEDQTPFMRARAKENHRIM